MKEIVIKVSDELLSFVYQNGFVPSEKRDELNHAILECVELPEGHGELIDARAFLQSIDTNDYDTYQDYSNTFDWIEGTETLVEADKGE